MNACANGRGNNDYQERMRAKCDTIRICINTSVSTLPTLYMSSCQMFRINISSVKFGIIVSTTSDC